MAIALFFTPAEDRAAQPLFPRRRLSQCTWPLWAEDEALHEKRCCGARVAVIGKRYCPEHARAATGAGTAGERSADREALAQTAKEQRHARA